MKIITNVIIPIAILILSASVFFASDTLKPYLAVVMGVLALIIGLHGLSNIRVKSD